MQHDARQQERDKAEDFLLVHTTHPTLHFKKAGESNGILTLEVARP